MRVLMSAIAFDAGTQIRAAIDAALVSEYAEAMTDGAQFPPIVLFHDGNRHYLADGFHRFMAAQRLAFQDIDADVKAGTKDDALWFALGANRKNGKRLTSTDLQYAIRLAFQTWPDKSTTLIAEQIGCTQQWVSMQRKQLTSTCKLPDRTVGKDGKSRPATRPSRERPERQKPVEKVDKSKAAVAHRREQIAAFAAEGYSSRQVAAKIGLAEETCREIARTINVTFTADQAMGRQHRHDATRIVEHIVMDAENLTADVNLIDFAALDREQIGDWIDALVTAKRNLESFIKRLVKEQKQHGEAA